MALKLFLPVKFMNSEYLPEVCLFSGRTDGVKEKQFPLDYCHIAVRIICVVLVCLLYTWLIAAIIYLIARKAVALTVPQASWERFKWSIKRQAWAFFLMLFAIGGCIGGGIVENLNSGPNGGWFALVFGLSVIAGLICAIGCWVWASRTTVSIRMADPEQVQLTFPDAMTPVYQAYRQAYETYQREYKPRRRRGDDAEEDWADNSDSSWDQSNAPPPPPPPPASPPPPPPPAN